jgi:oligopeptide transport system ATP-binding protein
MSLLEIEHLAIDLPLDGRPQTVIHDVSLRVDEGEIVGLVGESGSGKSLTARAINRLLPANATIRGEVRFGGQALLGLDRRGLLSLRANDIAMIFQDPRAHINPVRRIGDFLTEALVTTRDADHRTAVAKVTAALRETGITDAERRMRQFPHELSGGLLQRVMIAAAVAIEPRLIIADEPTTALDVTTQAAVMAILQELRDHHGVAVLLITHDLDLAAAVGDRTAVMYAGRICEERPSSTLHDRPLHPYTAALGASRPSPYATSQRLPAISGRPISGFEAPPGCPFHPRCPHAQPTCQTELPRLRALSDGVVACHRSEELAGKLSTTEDQTSVSS